MLFLPSVMKITKPRCARRGEAEGCVELPGRSAGASAALLLCCGSQHFVCRELNNEVNNEMDFLGRIMLENVLEEMKTPTCSLRLTEAWTPNLNSVFHDALLSSLYVYRGSISDRSWVILRPHPPI